MKKFISALTIAAPKVGQEFSANTFTAQVEGLRQGKETRQALRSLAAKGHVRFTGKVAVWERVA